MVSGYLWKYTNFQALPATYFQVSWQKCLVMNGTTTPAPLEETVDKGSNEDSPSGPPCLWAPPQNTEAANTVLIPLLHPLSF